MLIDSHLQLVKSKTINLRKMINTNQKGFRQEAT